MFNITDQQAEKLKEWFDARPERYGGAIGGRFTYSITPTSIGIIYKVKDNATGEEIDLTEYEDW